MKIKNIWFDNERIFIKTDKGKELSQSLLLYPRLLAACEKEKANYKTNAFGIHWEGVDEDVSFESFDYNDKEPNNSIALAFKAHPINVSKLAETMNIPRSLLAAYICGKKTPSDERKKEIEQALHMLGQKLLSVSL